MDIHSFTKPLTFNVIQLYSVSSTNTLAKQMLAKDEADEGLVIITEFQSEGRGQQNSVWRSENGKNLLCSLVLKPTFLAISEQTFLNMAICLAVSDFMLEHTRNVKIKWPNDIYINNKKTAGILIENSLNGSTIKNSVIGMGININQLSFDENKATSLSAETGVEYAREDILQQLLSATGKRYAQLNLKQFNKIRADYHSRLLGLNELKSFKVNEEVFDGMIVGVDDDGMLLVQRMTRIEKYMVKQIAMI